MKNILITTKTDNLVINYNYQNDNPSGLLFDENYVKDNPQVVATCMDELMYNKKINTIVITKFELLYLLKDVLKLINPVETLYINDDKNFTYKAYEIIIDISKFKKINCYSVPTYMMDLFSKNQIIVESRAEILFTSNFMEVNNLTSYSKIYYKSSLKIDPPLTEQDFLDIESFCKVNINLKSIHFNACNLDGIDRIYNILIENKIENVKISIHDNITNKDIIKELKKRKKLLSKNKIYLELKYTEEYVSKNYIKQILTTTLIFCAFITLTIAGGSTAYILISNKESEKNVEQILDKIEEKIAQDNHDSQPIDNNIELHPNDSIDTKIIPNMKSIKELNSDSVGWIKVSGTNIDYPVVQTTDNEFYLNHNFDKNYDYNGWVYMNYMNNAKDLDKNTILFAHNRYYSGVMFGTLHKVTNKQWYEDAKNLPIYYNTLFDELEWEVFSIYRVDAVQDYLKTNFSSDQEFLEFIDLLRSRSIFNSDIEITADDKILTLSTCVENDQRLVVHAVLKS